MGIFTFVALCVPVAVVACVSKAVAWIYRKIVDALEWRKIKKRYSFGRKAWMM